MVAMAVPETDGLQSTIRRVRDQRLSGMARVLRTGQTLFRTVVSTWSSTSVIMRLVASSWPSARRVASA